MSIELKSRDEIEKMRRAGALVAEVLAQVAARAVKGVTTRELDAMAEEMVRSRGGVPAFKDYQPDFIRCGPFPATMCASLNDVVVHGIPNDRRLEEGDLLSVDIGVELGGYFGDAAVTLMIGEVSLEARRLVESTSRSLGEAVRMCRPDNRLSDVSNAIQLAAEGDGFQVVRRFVGHGIGRAMHEDPPVLNYGKPGGGPVLRPGMVLAIEPMVNAGSFEVESSPDCWPVYTRDGSLSAHFEHTVAVTEGGPDVLTAPAVGAGLVNQALLD